MKKWQKQIKLIAKSNKSQLDKYHEVIQLAADFEPTMNQLKKFAINIYAQYVHKTYLHEKHALSLLFQSSIVYKSDNGFMSKFARYFHKNIMYTHIHNHFVCIEHYENKINKLIEHRN